MRSVWLVTVRWRPGGRSLWVRPSRRDEAFETCLDTSGEATGGRRRHCRHRRVKMMMIRQRG